HEGTGLGLAIAHQIIQEHRGNIEVQSVRGGGTTFLVNLPSSPAPPSVSPTQSPSPKAEVPNLD
ncbi:MAG TPA: ATP-binding protein, partial [Nitrospirales bacterium]|nr:ATP-binding protein [Nitrospirales bacterium]